MLQVDLYNIGIKTAFVKNLKIFFIKKKSYTRNVNLRNVTIKNTNLFSFNKKFEFLNYTQNLEFAHAYKTKMASKIEAKTEKKLPFSLASHESTYLCL